MEILPFSFTLIFANFLFSTIELIHWIYSLDQLPFQYRLPSAWQDKLTFLWVWKVEICLKPVDHSLETFGPLVEIAFVPISHHPLYAPNGIGEKYLIGLLQDLRVDFCFCDLNPFLFGQLQHRFAHGACHTAFTQCRSINLLPIADKDV